MVIHYFLEIPRMYLQSNPVYLRRGSPCGIVVNRLDCNIIVSKFKLPSCTYIHFWTNILAKGMNLLIPPGYVLNSNTTVLLQGWIWH